MERWAKSAEKVEEILAVGGLLEEQLNQLATLYEQDTFIFSSPYEEDHPAFQAIKKLGKEILPFIFRDLAAMQDKGFEDLPFGKRLLGWRDYMLCEFLHPVSIPIPEEHHGNILAINADVIAWGKANGYL